MTFIEKYIATPIDPASHAWCNGGLPTQMPSGKIVAGAECDWKAEGEWAHKDAHLHGNLLGHVTHVWSPDEPTCGDIYVGMFGGPYVCARLPEHKGLHRDKSGIEWTNVVGDNPVHSGENA